MVHQALILGSSKTHGGACCILYSAAPTKISLDRRDRGSREERRFITQRGHEWCHSCGGTDKGVVCVLDPGQVDTPGGGGDTL